MSTFLIYHSQGCDHVEGSDEDAVRAGMRRTYVATAEPHIRELVDTRQTSWDYGFASILIRRTDSRN
jgi:hypothetical protein